MNCWVPTSSSQTSCLPMKLHRAGDHREENLIRHLSHHRDRLVVMLDRLMNHLQGRRARNLGRFRLPIHSGDLRGQSSMQGLGLVGRHLLVDWLPCLVMMKQETNRCCHPYPYLALIQSLNCLEGPLGWSQSPRLEEQLEQSLLNQRRLLNQHYLLRVELSLRLESFLLLSRQDYPHWEG